MKRIGFWIWLLVAFAALFALNWWCIPAHDELAYTFQGECTPIEGTAHHIASLGDIVRSEMAEYSHGPSGRVFLHAFVQLFAGWELYHFFDFCNTLVWFVLVGLMLTEAKIRLSLRTYALGAALVFWFYFLCETHFYNMAFAVNYLWMSCVTILFVRAWRKYEAWWMLPIAFFYGWGQEVFSLAVLAAFGFCGFVELCSARKYPWGVKRSLAYSALFLGVCGCCGSHFLSGRAAEAESGGLGALVGKIAQAHFSLAVAFWPVVLLGLIAGILWFRRRDLRALFAASPEWWAIFLFGYLEYFALGKDGLRIASPMLLSGIILLILNRAPYVRWMQRLAVPGMVAAAVWMVVAAVLQYRIGRNLQLALEMYQKDLQGITCRQASNVGIWALSTSPHLFNRWHRALFRHQFKKEVPPAFLSPRLYETLYLDPPSFFREAEEVLPGGYMLPGESKYIVLKSDESVSPACFEECQKVLAQRARPTDWRRFLPGRLRVWFPASDLYVGMPSNPFTLAARDGKTYVIVMGEE